MMSARKIEHAQHISTFQPQHSEHASKKTSKEPQKLTSLTFLFIKSPARRERKPPVTESNWIIRVTTARGRFPQ